MNLIKVRGIDMDNKKWKTVGIGAAAAITATVSSILIRRFVKQKKETRFFDSVTEKDIAWG